MAWNQTHGTVFTGDSYFLSTFCLYNTSVVMLLDHIEVDTNHLEEITGLSRVSDVRCSQR